MNHDVRAHLMTVLAANNIPESLLAELMKERRTLRDSIAIAALPALIQRCTDVGGIEETDAYVAGTAYHLADAMLAERDGRAARRGPTKLTDEYVLSLAATTGLQWGSEAVLDFAAAIRAAK